MTAMYVRVIGGLVAWTAGAVLATALSLFAVSALGEGLSAEPVRTLTGDDVTRALQAAAASATAGTPSQDAAEPAPDSPAPSRSAAAAPAPAPSATPTAQLTGRGSAVGSAGGTALAVCGPAGAYLTSWSPAQGYEVTEVSRGPAPTASVEFDGPGAPVVLRVSCPSGIPTAQVTTGADDDRSRNGGTDH